MNKSDYIFDLIVLSIERYRKYFVINKKVCDDITKKWNEDFDALEKTNRGVTVSDSAGFIGFWICKLKPLVHKEDEAINSASELDIVFNEYLNEFIAIDVMREYLLDHVREFCKNDFSMLENTKRTFDEILGDLLKQTKTSFLTEVLDDLKYKTFDKHHVAHIARYMLQEAKKNGGVHQSAHLGNQPVKQSKNGKHMKCFRVFISAPGDIQEGYLEENGLLDLILQKNFRRWFRDFGVAVDFISQRNIPAEYDERGVQTYITECMGKDFEMYVGLVCKKVGTPTESNGEKFNSGTEAEYHHAISVSKKVKIPISFAFGEPDKNAFRTKEEENAYHSSEKYKIEALKKSIGDKQKYWGWDEKKNNFEERFLEQLNAHIKKLKDNSYSHI